MAELHDVLRTELRNSFLFLPEEQHMLKFTIAELREFIYNVGILFTATN